jgi:hypothetical protein
MLDDLEERIRRLETAARVRDEGWPDATRLPEPLLWADRAAAEGSVSERDDSRLFAVDDAPPSAGRD